MNFLKKMRTVSNFSKVKTQVTSENPPTEKSFTKSLNTSIATINKIINQDLQLKKVKNTKFSPAFVKACSSTQNIL